jgi:hypothetical protein
MGDLFGDGKACRFSIYDLRFTIQDGLGLGSHGKIRSFQGSVFSILGYSIWWVF